MTAITADELSHQTEDVLRRVRDGGETIGIVEGGAVVARLVPAAPAALIADAERYDSDEFWEEMARLAAEKEVRVSELAEINEAESPGRALSPAEAADVDAWLAEIDRLVAEIAKHWPEGVSSVDAVREQRRELVPEEWASPRDEHEQPPGRGDDHDAIGAGSTGGRGR